MLISNIIELLSSDACCIWKDQKGLFFFKIWAKKKEIYKQINSKTSNSEPGFGWAKRVLGAVEF